jgi:hypothetical protein
MKKLLVSLITVGCLQFVVPVYAQVPGIINYQGRVVVGGTNFDGTGLFRFALVDGTGATNYWSNDGTAVGQPSISVSLPVTKGLYSVLLGDTTIPNMTTSISPTAFANSNVRLRVWFNDGVHGFEQLSPDQRIAAVGYAMMAGNVPAGATSGPGCYIVRAGTNISFGSNIAAWAGAVQSGDAAMINGGFYVVTNFNFNWSGKRDLLLSAVHSAISLVYTSYNITPSFPPGCSIILENCTNVLCTGDWNLRAIFTSTYPVDKFAYLIDAGHQSANITFDGLHVQMELQSQPIGGEDKALVAVSGGNIISNIVFENCRVGYIPEYSGGETDNANAPVIGAFHGNGDTPAVTINNCIFYGGRWHGLGWTTGNTPWAHIYNSWGLDGTSYVNPNYDSYTAVLGSIDATESLSYYLPGTPLPQMQVVTNAVKRVPPDWNLPTISGTNVTYTIGGTNYTFTPTSHSP